MKKVLLLTVFVLSLLGCKEHRVISTFYGDFDLDTMEVAFTRNGSNWYEVRNVEKDSFNWDGKWMYIDGPVIDYYCPDSNLYEESWPDNQGNMIIKEIDPYHQYDWLNN